MNALSWFIDGRMRLMTMSFSKPATLRWMARKSSAMPPVASLRSSVYLPKLARAALATDGVTRRRRHRVASRAPFDRRWCGAHLAIDPRA